MPSLSRNGTILLELKRRYVSQRLNELQITLGNIRRCQQRDSKSEDGTRGRTQADRRAAQRGEREHYPGVDGCSSAHDRWQDSISASQSHSQQPVESRGLGDYKLESHISDQRRSVQGNILDTVQACQMPEGQDRPHLSVSGKQELNSQLTIENTTGQTDTDDVWVSADQKVDLNMDKC